MAPDVNLSPFAVLRRRNFALMWTGQLVSTIGSALTSLAASILVFRVTGGSALSVGLMLMATAAPSLLVGLLPVLAGLTGAERSKIASQGRVLDVAAGTRLTPSGEQGDCAYFVLSGKAVAGISDGAGGYRSLSSMAAGDYFGEFAALTGAARTADVVAEEPTRLLEVPATVLRVMMARPEFSQMVLSRMTERLARTTIHDLPRFLGVDQQAARELREETPVETRAEPQTA